MNEIERHLARAAGVDTVQVGQDITIHIDLAAAHDVTAPMAISQFEKIGVDKVFDEKKVMLVIDHIFPAPSIPARQNHRQLLAFADKYHVRCYGKGEGVIHQLIAEQGGLTRGAVLIGADSHTCTAGAYGVLAFGVGSTEIAAAMATGTLDIEVPPVQLIRLEGETSPGVYAKDIILYLIGKFGTDGFTDQGIIFAGSWVKQADIEEKMTISNMAIEMGAMLSYFSENDEVGSVRECHLIEVNKLVPVMACPSSPGNVKPIAKALHTAVNQVVIGSCTNGRISDMRAAAKVFSRAKVHPQVTCIVLPASNKVAETMEKEGLTRIMRAAGVTVMNPGCGPCYGGHMGIVTADDVVVATTNRNFPGRMGAKEAKLYLASPRAAAEAAVCGQIVVPGTAVPLGGE
ncbi:3-isopropylmalate dehydratase large subunit [Sporomusa acidovorans]|uniref:3-isopropylmalate dehydratase large subunit n=1 Tax=Sporomusa acidovorans (strain ATCC 49682 / DSM 3132 / Mol) TaxID=1123286 RepID=A0ABZ3J332_SPOA4|nr:aconitase/3-isopropylmalate dehydratase large subunit family protein [Sporomusa acidovorans]OZC19961.1 2,3-dimethylmalate dehydratase large subunit [Sporomusa acidovorans DSM 3132]SDD48993.1 3-isopropylmalate/(R)-2-methylmalate dehydratase large subunit [Sporomusa acidovorans]